MLYTLLAFREIGSAAGSGERKMIEWYFRRIDYEHRICNSSWNYGWRDDCRVGFDTQESEKRM